MKLLDNCPVPLIPAAYENVPDTFIDLGSLALHAKTLFS